jgi:hypothetical protein
MYERLDEASVGDFLASLTVLAPGCSALLRACAPLRFRK